MANRALRNMARSLQVLGERHRFHALLILVWLRPEAQHAIDGLLSEILLWYIVPVSSYIAHSLFQSGEYIAEEIVRWVS